MNYLENLYSKNIESFSDNEKEILSYIVKHPQKITNLSINELAKETLTSKSSVYRVAQKLGFSGYAELKYYLATEIKKEAAKKYINTLDDELNQTLRLYNSVDTSAIIEQITNANQVFCYGTGTGQRIALDNFKRGVMIIDRFVINISAPRELKTASEYMTDEDVLIVVSLSGDVSNIKETLQHIQLRGSQIIGVTRIGTSVLSELADFILYFQAVPKYALGKEFVSFMPVFYVLELLVEEMYVRYIEEKGGIL